MSSYTAGSREAGRAPLPIDTARTNGENWWLQPLLTVILLTAFGIYATYRAFENTYFCYPWVAAGAMSISDAHRAVESATYLSPLFSPFIPISLSLGSYVVSPAFYILIFPGAFRITCYYYRKAYYRAFFWDPPACALAEPRAESRMKYTGERAFPFILQNLHRYAFYAAVVFIFILSYDAIRSFIFTGQDGRSHFGIHLGSLIFVLNVVLLACYTFGCHSWRHLIGGGIDCYSCSALSRTRYGLWQKVSFLNERHALFAWSSLFSVALVDVYVNLVARGLITDLSII